MVTFSIEVDGIIENISVSEDFKPIYGCAEVCPIETIQYFSPIGCGVLKENEDS